MKIEEGYRELRVNEKCKIGDGFYRVDAAWIRIAESDSGKVITDLWRPVRRHITAELDNALTKLAYKTTNWPKSDYRYAYLTADDEPNFTRNKHLLMPMCSGTYTLAQINEEKARWNLPLIEVEDSSEWVPEVGQLCKGWVRAIDGANAENQAWEKVRLVVSVEDVHIVNRVGDDQLCWCSEFKPIETPEQKKARERDEGIAEMYEAFANYEGVTPDWEQMKTLYDWLKENKKL